MISKIKKFFAALTLAIVGVPAANAAALDTSDLSDITSSLNTAASWLNGPVMSAIVALIVATIIIAIVKFAGRKARPS